MPILDVDDLCVSVPTPGGRALAVEGVSFRVAPGEGVALVGESGCGKSLTALALAGLLPSGVRRERGTVRFEGRVVSADDAGARAVRGRGMAYVFQEPAAALNPVMRIGAQIGEVLRRHRPEVDAGAETLRLLARVGMPEPAARARAWPHELSGGQCQRAMLAMALAGQPRLLVADEPTTALDVTLQAQMLDLLAALAREDGMALLLITHDLGIVARAAARLLVMYAGVVVEQGPAEAILRAPEHPYTRGLLAAAPRLDDRPHSPLAGVPGQVPGPGRRPAGCVFHPRCPAAREACRANVPALAPTGDGSRSRRCPHADCPSGRLFV